MFGKPEAVLSDNGMQWTAMRGGECRFDILCNELGIKPTRGKPYKLTNQGKIEGVTAALRLKLVCQSLVKI